MYSKHTMKFLLCSRCNLEQCVKFDLFWIFYSLRYIFGILKHNFRAWILCFCYHEQVAAAIWYRNWYRREHFFFSFCYICVDFHWIICFSYHMLCKEPLLSTSWIRKLNNKSCRNVRGAVKMNITTFIDPLSFIHSSAISIIISNIGDQIFNLKCNCSIPPSVNIAHNIWYNCNLGTYLICVETSKNHLESSFPRLGLV